MRIVIVGAGRVGCGALGMALALQGQELVFAARRDEIVDSINKFGFDVVTKGDVEVTVPVRGVRAVNFMNAEEFAAEVVAADQIFTCVRPDNLPGVGPILAQAILHRIDAGVSAPLDVFCCENLKNAGSQLERLVFTNIPFKYARDIQTRVSFNAAISDRIVSGQHTDETGRMVFTADATGDVLYDSLNLKGEFVPLPPFKGIDNFPACIEEKLYVLNCGHAVCAYLGHLRGYQYIHEAIADEQIGRAVVGAMLEAQQGLQAKHGRNLHYANFINEILGSFSNAALMDTVARVGRDPLRKLQPDDRLVGPAKLAYRYGIETHYLIQGCAAAMSFDNPADPQAAELQTQVREHGVAWALDTVSQLRPWNPLSRLIQAEARELGID
jgi:mannitol-1-phosphate 5-dehydrogenase